MPLKLYRRGSIWHYRGVVAGRELRSSTFTADKAIAERLRAQAEADEWNRRLDGPGAHVTMAQAAIAYRESGKPVRFLEPIEDYWRDTPIRNITDEAVRQSAKKLYPKAKASTRNRQVIAPTQAIINYAAGLWRSPKITVKKFDVVPQRREAVDLAWVETFAANAVPHLGALCVFMFGTGARLGEAVRLTWRDVDLTARTARLTGNKPKPWARMAHLPAAVFDAMANIPAGNRNPDDRVFQYLDGQNVGQSWDAVIERAGLKRLTPHSCRHGSLRTCCGPGSTWPPWPGWAAGKTLRRS